MIIERWRQFYKSKLYLLDIPGNTFHEGRPRSDAPWGIPSWKIAAHQILRRYSKFHIGLLILFVLIMAIIPGVTYAQESGPVQLLNGSIHAGDLIYYRLPDLQRGDTLYVYVDGISGNLDPVTGLLDSAVDPAAAEEAYVATIQQAIVNGEDPLLAMEAAFDSLLLIWDDDSGEGLAATFAYEIPADGGYRLLISDALTAAGSGTFGDYRLLIGVEAPDVLTGEATPTGETIAFLDEDASLPGSAVQEIIATLTAEQQQEVFEFESLRPGDTVYIFAESIADNLNPALLLRNYANKPLRSANLTGQEPQAVLEYSVQDGGAGYNILLMPGGDAGVDASSAGEYRLLVGVNEAEVLTGEAASSGDPLIKQAIPVQIGVKLQQIVDVNEQNEFFTAVASLQMEWIDPALAFSPDSCNCVFKVYTDQDFGQFLAENEGHFPEFTIFNQQGNRWTQNRLAVIHQDGRALYFERFSTNLQVDFDFSQYPFDSEEFIIRIDSIFPESFYYFTDLEGFSEISADHGEDEFIIDGFETAVTSEQASTQSTTSRFTFTFGGPRHLDYYVLQIFMPLLLILSVSWVTFFLRDYGRRIEVASANLLVFIAFSFSLSDNYPRLGYLTFLDAVMATMFILSALVVVYNVWLRRMEMNGQEELANRVDNVLDWLYPITLIGSGILLYVLFF